MLILETVAESVIEGVLKSGGVDPTLLVECRDETMLLSLPDFPDTHDEKCSVLRQIGRQLKSQKAVIYQVIWISENWMISRTPDDTRPVDFKSKDRRECLIIASLDMQGNRRGLFYEMNRDKSGHLFEITPMSMGDAQNFLLDEVLVGYQEMIH